MERLLLCLLTEDIPSAISFSIIALLPLTALAVWKGSRVLFIAVAFVCLNGELARMMSRRSLLRPKPPANPLSKLVP